MKTKEKILETILKIQELVESIADNQHRQEYDFTRDQSGNRNDLKPVNEKPFPKYWWTYTEGLPDVIKDWFNEMRAKENKGCHWHLACDFTLDSIGRIDNMGCKWCHGTHKDTQYVTHQQIMDHYGLEEKPKGLPESWCIDIRVDDPRVEGFKAWLNKETNFDWDYDDYNDYWGISEKFQSGPMLEGQVPRMTILTLDQFEQLSGVNLMDYTKKEEVKIEPDEQPKKLYTKEEILEQYGKYRMENSFNGEFLDWIYENM